MIRNVMVAIVLMALPVGIAGAQSGGQTGEAVFTPETRAVIATKISVQNAAAALSDFEARGGSAQTVAMLAEAGHRDAARLLGRRCLEQGFCDLTRQKSHDLLVAAANTQAESAMALARIYRNGKWGGQAYPVSAAQWYAHAHKLGAPFAKVEIQTLPRLSVIEAGAGDLLPPLTQTAEGPSSLPPLRTDIAPKPDQSVSNPADNDTTATASTATTVRSNEDVLMALESWLSPDVPLPTVLTWPGKAKGYPVFADTRLDAPGDAAASCFAVVMARMERNLARAKAGTATVDERASLEPDGSLMSLYLDFIKQSAQRGGSSTREMDDMINVHELNAKMYPSKGPSLEFCKQHLVGFMTDVIVAEAMVGVD